MPNYESQDGGAAHQGSTRELESDYYLGGYDIDSEYPPPHEEEFLSRDQLPPPLPEDFPDQYEALPPSQPTSLTSTMSPDCRRRPRFHPSQYLPPHPLPGETDLGGPSSSCDFSTFAVNMNQGTEVMAPTDSVSLSLHNSRGTSSSEMSARCGFDDSEVAMSDYESAGELSLTNLHIPFVETQQQTQVYNITLVQDPATAALLHKSNGIPFRSLRAGDGRNVYQEVGPPQVPVRPMAYTPCFQSDSRSNLDKGLDVLGGEPQEMSTFHPESPRILTARRGVVVCSVAPNLPAVSPCRSDCDSIRKNGWDTGSENKGTEDTGEVTCFTNSNKGSNSEVQSLSSFQSDSGDDNVSVMDQGQNYNRAYHWDTSDWMPGARLSDIEEMPNYESQEDACWDERGRRSLPLPLELSDF